MTVNTAPAPVRSATRPVLAVAAVAATVLLRGSSFVVIRAAGTDLSPGPMALLRMGVATLVMAPVALRAGVLRRMPRGRLLGLLLAYGGAVVRRVPARAQRRRAARGRRHRGAVRQRRPAAHRAGRGDAAPRGAAAPAAPRCRGGAGRRDRDVPRRLRRRAAHRPRRRPRRRPRPARRRRLRDVGAPAEGHPP